ncbi:MAG: RagB/SusD family nutrient uptake outer membrane protein, partial [Bacteroidaceae bacterium]
HLWAFYGPQGWTPKIAGSGSGWGFWEPSEKYIKFMLDRGEKTRLETTVLFTNRGMADLETDPNYATLPDWISNTTPSGDVINDYARALFASGKHYLPSDQLIEGRTEYGSNKNFIMIRYAEVLLSYAEAVVNGGAIQNGMTAVQAVNIVRTRAGLSNLSSVTLDDVLDEKYAELACEQGQRFWDLLRYDKYSELSYDGRTFTEDKKFLPYPLKQIDSLPVLEREVAAEKATSKNSAE